MKKKNIAIYSIYRWKAPVFQFLSNKKHLIFILIGAYCLADLIIISLLPLFLPGKIFPSSPVLKSSQKMISFSEYTPILDFNIFHNAAIPASLSTVKERVKEDTSPQLSLLPLQLNGTIVYSNPLYSIANITVKNKTTSESYQVDDTVDSLAQITQIDSERVYLINLNSNRTEYIEMRNMHNIRLDFEQTSPFKKSNNMNTVSGTIRKTGNFQFQVNRSDVNKHLRSLPSILREAKVVAHSENGKIIGFRFKYIKPGSIYEELGFKVSDIITSVEGEPVRSQLHAAELFQRFKNRTQVDIMVKREGKNIPFSWSVQEDVSIEEPPKSQYY